MLRQLEFRAYDNIEHEYYYALSSLNFENGPQGIGSITVVNNVTCEWIDIMNDEYNNNLIIEQYTGFNDDNNCKIFEGDIVETVYEMDYITGKEYKNADDYKKELGEIKWCEDKGSWYVWGWGSLGYIKETAQHIKIIGNIHKNKEMIK
jgi:uncharacterized phage protein (TIGR01671 family)